MSLHLDSINNPSDAEFSVILKTQALGRGRTNPGVARVKSEPRVERNLGKKRPVDDQLPYTEVPLKIPHHLETVSIHNI